MYPDSTPVSVSAALDAAAAQRKDLVFEISNDMNNLTEWKEESKSPPVCRVIDFLVLIFLFFPLFFFFVIPLSLLLTNHEKTIYLLL